VSVVCRHAGKSSLAFISCRVRDSIKLSVSKVTLEQYDSLNSEPQDLRKAGGVEDR